MKLIINADDFGLTRDTNRAIKELVKYKTVSSTTVMVNMPYAIEIKDFVKFDHLGIGLHFNLTEGSPITPCHQVKSLVNNLGSFYPYLVFRKRLKKGLIDKQEIQIELDNQFQLLESFVLNRITHIDSHQSIHRLGVLYPLIHDFAIEKKIGIRPGRRYFIKKNDKGISVIKNPLGLSFMQFTPRRILSELYYELRDLFLKNKAFMPKAELLAVNFKKLETLKNLMSLEFKTIQDTYEISCHPSLSIDELDVNKTKLLEKRKLEYELLSSKEFVDFTKKNPLVNFKSLIKE